MGSDHDLQPVGAGGLEQRWRGDALLDRDAPLAALDALLEGARAGFGRAVIVRGPAGIGKTRLLGELRRRAGEGGLTTLTARGGELERDFPFGCVRQLFESLIRRGEQSEALLSGDARLAEAVFAPPGDERGPSPDPSYGVLHGLYWLTVNLAEQGPLLLALDDAHWADPASLRYLSFLTRRLDGVPALVALTARPAEPGAESDLLRRLSHDPLTEVVDLSPLSPGSVATIVRAHLDGEVTERTTALCHQATRGNPFLLRELLREVEREVGTPGVVDLERIEELGPERVAEAVTSRLERLGAEAPDLGRSLAVLGDGAELRRAAALADLDPDQAARLADALGSAGILEPGRPLRFAHPIVRNAVYGQMPRAERDRWHRRAGSMLADAGESAETVSVHLLATEPAGRPGVVDVLRRAADSASSRGAPDSAVRFLERALAEPASPALRPIVLSELGRNAAPLGDPRAHEWLREAVELGAGSPVAMEAAVDLGRALTFTGAAEEVMDVGQRVLAGSGRDGEPGRRLERWLLSLAQISPATRGPALELVRRNLDAALAGRDLPAGLLANAALECAMSDGTAEVAGTLAERAVREGLLADQGAESLEPAIAAAALVLAERLEIADRLMSEGLQTVRSRGNLRGYAGALSFRAWGRYREGRLADVRADAELYPRFSRPTVTDLVIAGAHVLALVDAGRLGEAAAVADPILATPLDRSLTLYQRFAEGLAALRLAEGDPRGALEVTRGVAAWEEGTGLRNGTWVGWRSQAALAHAALGEDEPALSLAEEQVALARAFEAPGMLGSALRVTGVVLGEEDGLAALREAADHLGRSSLRLEHARALIDLGTGLRRAGRQAEAREPLRDGLELAHGCGAAALADIALDELVAAGARPRRPSASDADALTPSERRVAEMAANGMTNKRIAQALFVTVKTVETHLGHAYQKLGINSRAQLTTRLARPD